MDKARGVVSGKGSGKVRNNNGNKFKKKKKQKRKNRRLKKNNKQTSRKKFWTKKARTAFNEKQLNCNNITCLNNLLEVLKVDKDTVQNYMQRKRRLDARLRLAGAKQKKSSAVNETITYLTSAFGGETALARKSPICAGRYNSSKAQEVGEVLIFFILPQGARLLLNISRCDEEIQAACNITRTANSSDAVAGCYRVMLEYR